MWFTLFLVVFIITYFILIPLFTKSGTLCMIWQPWQKVNSKQNKLSRHAIDVFVSLATLTMDPSTDPARAQKFIEALNCTLSTLEGIKVEDLFFYAATGNQPNMLDLGNNTMIQNALDDAAIICGVA